MTLIACTLSILAAAAPIQAPGQVPVRVDGPSADPPTAVLRGRVESEATGRPLAGAVVDVRAGGESYLAVTDAEGRYVFHALPAGRATLRVHRIGYAPRRLELALPAAGEFVLDLRLEPRPLRLAGVTVRTDPPVAVRAASVALTPPELITTSVRALEATPGIAELGLADVYINSPGREPPDPSDVLYVRGAAADLDLVLLDGAPVYTPFHLGGLIAPFPPGVLAEATLYRGGAPARYDGGLSYVLALETRAGRSDGFHSAGAVDLLTARALVETPVGERVTLLVSGRALHPLGAELLPGGEEFPYRYGDALARLDVDVGTDATVSATGFWNHESVRLDPPNGSPERPFWGNTAGSLRYRGPLFGARAQLTAAFGRFHSRVPLGDWPRALATGTARRVRIAADLHHRLGELDLRYGAAYRQRRLRYRVRARPNMRTVEVATRSIGGRAFGAYVGAAWQVSPAFRLRGGIRADIFSLDPAVRFGPRLRVTWFAGEHTALTLAAGRYHQYVRTPYALGNLADSVVSPFPSEPAGHTAPLTVARASHLVLSLEQRIGKHVQIGLNGFFKKFGGLPAADGMHGRASGVDVRVRRSTDRLTAWLGYSLTWVWSVEGERRATERFAGRQLLSAGLAGRIGGFARVRLRAAYAAGLPYTTIPATAPGMMATDRAHGRTARVPVFAVVRDDAPLPGPPEEPYLRLGAEVSHSWTAEWWGTDIRLTPYLKVLNPLDQRGTLFYRTVADGREPRPVASLPVLPIVGMRWRF